MSDNVPTPQVLLLADWQNAGPTHWLSRWQAAHGYRRVVQHDGLRPLRGDWMMQLEEAVLESKPGLSVTLVAHGLGCLLVAAWAVHSRHRHRVKAALLVAPTDVEREALRALLASWSPIPCQPLPFNSILVGSRDDPHCSFERAQALAQAWGSEFLDGGQPGQTNAESGRGAWPQGHALLVRLSESGQLGAGPKRCSANQY
ncbi:RBBP9/YdeN family alpha/beta hydrolase [Rhodoferax sp.]|uniref:RBBP9/YdeN family alpha/beta hydrolase n=1 Tax=Rhodoferax sp. TaxID=50421 RepID=UPI00374D209C